MRATNVTLIAGVIVVLLITAVFGMAARRTRRLSDGAWGGDHIHIEITDGSAQVEYDCANGEVKGPLTLTSDGRFSWSGFYTRESPGPIRLGRNPRRVPATYSGSITGDTMSLTVKLDDGMTLDAFTLKRGVMGRIRKCK